MPGRRIAAGRAQAFPATAGQQAMPINSSGDDPDKGAALSRRRAAASRRRLYAGALSAARRRRRRGRRAGMLSARAEAFRQLSRTGDEALAVRDPAQCLPRRIRAARRVRPPPRSTIARRRRADAAMARGAGNAGDADAAPARRVDDPADWSTALAEPFRETFVLREIHNLSYREIADIVDAPVGTVMSRLARARAMLRSAWMAEEEQPT